MPLRMTGILSLLILCIAGCNRDSNYKMKTAPVTGILTCKGTPVSGVQVIFSPHAKEGSSSNSGKAAMGSTDENGRFTLSTYQLNDGAVIGTHTVSFAIDYNPDSPDQQKQSEKQMVPCLKETLEVDVVPAMESLTLELGK